MKLLFLVFSISCLYDPEDISSVKLYTFSLLLLLTVLRLLIDRKINIPIIILLYIGAFIIIPIITNSINFIVDYSENDKWFAMYKAYLFILILPIIYVNRINAYEQVANILTSISMVTIFIYLFIYIDLIDASNLTIIGEEYRTLAISLRKYSDNFNIFQIYFYVSPMIVMAIGYYFSKLSDNYGGKFVALIIINAIGLLLSGTRANIISSFILTGACYLVYKNYKIISVKSMVLILFSIIFIGYYFSDFFNTEEYSNSVKINYLIDYIRIFSDMKTILIGRGLGSLDYWTATNTLFYTTELTYLEILRNFGFILGSLLIIYLIYPIKMMLNNSNFKSMKYLMLSYISYLIMCFVNPHFFSSMGILVLSITLVEILKINAKK